MTIDFILNQKAIVCPMIIDNIPQEYIEEVITCSNDLACSEDLLVGKKVKKLVNKTKSIAYTIEK